VELIPVPGNYQSWEDFLAFTWLNKTDEATEDVEEVELTDQMKNSFFHLFRQPEEGSEEVSLMDRLNPMNAFQGPTKCPHCGESLLPKPDPEDLKPKQFMGMEIPFSDGQNKDRFMAFFQGGNDENGEERVSLMGIAGNLNPVKAMEGMQTWGGPGQQGGNGAPMVVETCGHKFKVEWCNACKYRTNWG